MSGDADRARVERYAQAIFKSQDGWPIAWVDLHEDVQAGYLDEARVAIALADEEHAALVADREAHERHAEELSQVVAGMGNEADYYVTRCRELEVLAGDAQGRVADLERQVEAVRALADEWTPVPAVNTGDTFGYAAERIRAALTTAAAGTSNGGDS